MNKFYRNEYLFSEIYLREITEIKEDVSIKATLKTIEQYYEYAHKDSIKKWNETFIHEILNSLQFGVKKVSDNLSLLYKIGDVNNNISLCYSLLPDENIDSSLQGKNYAEKIIRSLKNNNFKWGILTNGEVWRIYHTEEATPYENYLEIKLIDIIKNEDIKQFQIFYYFLKSDNFIPDNDKKCKYDYFKEESLKKIDYIENELKNALKQKEEGGKGILSNISMGYVDFLRKNGKSNFNDDKIRDTIYGSAMLYMFRLLFLFYANARDLLSKESPNKFKEIVNESKINFEKGILNKDSYKYWELLRDIFSSIDLTYNGGLFNPSENDFTEFIEKQKISDSYLLPVIYYMTHYNENGRMIEISYRDMGVRHLGTLYEGLLEHKLFIADEDTEVKIDKKEIRFIPVSQGGKIVQGKYIPKGLVYFGADKGERKATGSYYTPEYIVDYIVTNTVTEKLKEMKNEFISSNKDILDSLKKAINENEKKSISLLLSNKINDFIHNKILKLSVLDPAMGSGHFLVNATSQIVNFLTEFYNDFDIYSDTNTSGKLLRRKVVENCIYGVDLNPLAVELAKLSLWILSMAKDAPLSFLNHHLKQGNSLIGARIDDIGNYPKAKSKIKDTLFDNNAYFKQAIDDAVINIRKIEELDSNNLSAVSIKKKYLDKANEDLKPFKAIFDMHTSIYFGSDIDENEYDGIVSKQVATYQWNGDNYFHWELEFPEVFFGLRQAQPDSIGGFDCVVGNPPYVRQESLGNQKKYFEIFEVYNGTADLYTYFLEKGHKVLNNKGILSLITSNKWMRAKYGYELRKYFKEKSKILKIVDFCGFKVFESAMVDVNIIFVGKIKNYKLKSDNNIKILSIGSDFSQDINIDDYFIKNNIEMGQNDLDINCFSFGNQGVLNLKRKVERIGTPLKEWDVNIYRGVTAGFNEAFIIDNETKEKLCREDPKSSEILKPILRGRDIDKYSFKWAGLWLIFTYTNIKIENYPSIYNHLLKYKINLDEVWEAKHGKKKWYELRGCNYYQEFEKEKIIWQEIVQHSCFTWDFDYYYGLAKTFIMTGKESNKYLLSILNSKLGDFALKKYYSPFLGDKASEFKKEWVQLLPIPKIPESKQKRFIEVVDKILTVKKINPDSDTTDLERQIDEMVYQLYELTPEEIRIVEEGAR